VAICHGPSTFGGMAHNGLKREIFTPNFDLMWSPLCLTIITLQTRLVTGLIGRSKVYSNYGNAHVTGSGIKKSFKKHHISFRQLRSKVCQNDDLFSPGEAAPLSVIKTQHNRKRKDVSYFQVGLNHHGK